jgi:hypothetical protein
MSVTTPTYLMRGVRHEGKFLLGKIKGGKKFEREAT